MNPNRTITVQTKHGPIEVPVPGMAFDDGGQSTVYVANVNQSITIAQIEQFFRAVCGEVCPPTLPSSAPPLPYLTQTSFSRTA
jgi:hypothetical protein